MNPAPPTPQYHWMIGLRHGVIHFGGRVSNRPPLGKSREAALSIAGAGGGSIDLPALNVWEYCYVSRRVATRTFF